jgi:hypothetical protein
MLGVTIFGVFLTPVFYVLIRRIAKPRRVSAPQPAYQPAVDVR